MRVFTVLLRFSLHYSFYSVGECMDYIEQLLTPFLSCGYPQYLIRVFFKSKMYLNVFYVLPN